MIEISDLRRLKSYDAVAKYLKSNFNADPNAFVDALDRKINSLLTVNLKKSKAYLAAVEGVFEFLPKKLKPRLYTMQGRLLLWSGNPPEGLKYYLKARRIYQKRRDSRALARLGNGLLDAYMYLGRYDDAIRIGRESLRYFKRKKAASDTGRVLNNMGNVYHRMDKNRQALRLYEQAREVIMNAGGAHLGVIEYNRANIYANLNNLKEAERLYRIAADMYSKDGMEISQTRAEYSIAYLYFLQDRFTEAIKNFERVYDRFSRLGERKSAAVTMLDMAEIDIHLNQFSSAVTIAGQIIPEFMDMGLRYEQSKACYFAAEACISLGDYNSACRQLRKARDLFSRENNNLWLGMVSIARGKLDIARRRYGQASKAASEAILLFEKSGDRRRKTDAELSLLRAAVYSGNNQKAFRLSSSLYRKKLVGYQIYSLNYLMGRCYYRLGNYSKALSKFKTAVAVVEKMLAGLYPDEIRFFFAIDKYDCYKMVVECLLHLDKVDASFLANLHALKTINHKSDYELRSKAQIPQNLIENRNSLRAALKKLNHISVGEQRGINGKLSYASIEQKLWANERKIRSLQYPENLHVSNGSTVADEIILNLKEDEILINFFSSENRIGAFLVSSEETRFIDFDITPSELDLCLQKLHFIFESAVFATRKGENSEIARSYLGFIYDKLFSVLRGNLHGKKVIIVADGSFAQIPFNALSYESGQYLMDGYDLRIIINPDDLCRGHQVGHKYAGKRNAVFAVSSDSLPSTKLEAQRIKNIFKRSHLYLENQASSGNLIREIGLCDGFLHIAAHASRASENPLFSRILLGDGPFFPFDLFESGIRAELVTLSGCQTAAPGLYYGNSFSLAKAFFQAGARYVLATLWPVSDKISMVFMTHFYESLRKKDDIFSAFSDAVRGIKEITDNPAFWSSFILLGI